MGGYGRHGKLGWVSAQAVMGGTGVNGLTSTLLFLSFVLAVISWLFSCRFRLIDLLHSAHSGMAVQTVDCSSFYMYIVLLLLLLLLQSRVLANTDSGIMDGCSPQVAVHHKGANLASVTETNISSKGDYLQSKFYLIIMQFFIPLTPKIFRGDLPSEKVKEFISANLRWFSFQPICANCYCDRDFLLTSCPGGIFQWFTLNIGLNLIGRKI